MSVSTRSRRGFAFMLLSVIVLIVVAAATQQLLRGQLLQHREHADRYRDQAMLAAIEAAQRVGEDVPLPITLPVDETHEITVDLDETGEAYVATWKRGDQAIKSIARPRPTQNLGKTNE